MSSKLKKYGFIVSTTVTFFIVFFSESVFAKGDLPTFGDIANKLVVGTDVITKLMLVACFVVGAILIFTAFTYYKEHRQTPKMIPLDRPIVYFLLGLSLWTVPFLGEFILPTASTIDIKKQEARRIKDGSCPVDIDAPLEFGNEYNH